MASWNRPAPAGLSAIEIYLAHAYEGSATRHAARLDTLRGIAAGDLFSSSVFERVEEAGVIIRYSLRLGNRVYPHMKLTIDRAPTGERHFFRVDTHDRHVRPPAGSPEEQAFADLMASNQRSAQTIEAAWEASGIPTFKTFIRDDLARREIARESDARQHLGVESGEMGDIAIEPIIRTFTARIAPPGSKSLTNRALILAALANGECELTNVLFADDTLVMLDCLERLGFAPQIDRASRTVRIGGRGGAIPKASAQLFCGNSGTTIRFVAALCAWVTAPILSTAFPACASVRSANWWIFSAASDRELNTTISKVFRRSRSLPTRFPEASRLFMPPDHHSIFRQFCKSPPMLDTKSASIWSAHRPVGPISR